MDGSRRRERGNKQKAECYCFALCLEYQPRRSMRRTMEISNHEIPPSQRQGKKIVDTGVLETVATAAMYVLHSWWRQLRGPGGEGGWRSRGQRKEGEQQCARYLSNRIDERGEKEGRLGKAARTLIFLHSPSPGYN